VAEGREERRVAQRRLWVRQLERLEVVVQRVAYNLPLIDQAEKYRGGGELATGCV